MASGRRSNPNGVGNAFHGTPNFSILSDLALYFEKRDKKLFRTFQHKEKLKRSTSISLETHQQQISALIELNQRLEQDLRTLEKANSIGDHPHITFSTLQLGKNSKFFTKELTPKMVKSSRIFVLVAEKALNSTKTPPKPPKKKRRKADAHLGADNSGTISPTKIIPLYPLSPKVPPTHTQHSSTPNKQENPTTQEKTTGEELAARLKALSQPPVALPPTYVNVKVRERGASWHDKEDNKITVLSYLLRKKVPIPVWYQGTPVKQMGNHPDLTGWTMYNLPNPLPLPPKSTFEMNRGGTLFLIDVSYVSTKL